MSEEYQKAGNTVSVTINSVQVPMAHKPKAAACFHRTKIEKPTK